MSKIELKSENVDAAYAIADPATKQVLDALLGRRKTPTLDDHTSIESYEDACVALRETPGEFHPSYPPHIVALMKLETVSRALWGRTFQPKPDAEGKETYWWPWHALYTKREIENMTAEDRGALLAVTATFGALAGFGSLSAAGRSSFSAAGLGCRLCQETADKARYFGCKFIRLWAEYLKFNFEITEE